MSSDWRDAKRAQALVKNDKFYSPNELVEAWKHVLTGPYADKIIYSLYEQASRPHIKYTGEHNIQHIALMKEGKRELVDAILAMPNGEITKERKA